MDGVLDPAPGDGGHPSPVPFHTIPPRWAILRECGWSRQKFDGRAVQRDEVLAGRKSAGSRSKKSYRGAADPGVRRPVWVLPAAPGIAHLRPGGPDPGDQGDLSHDHLSAMSGITPQGKLYMTVQERSYKGPDVVNSSTCCATSRASWVGTEPRFIAAKWSRNFWPRRRRRAFTWSNSPLTPQLNDEGICNYLERVELKNSAVTTYVTFGWSLRAKERLRHKYSGLFPTTSGCV